MTPIASRALDSSALHNLTVCERRLFLDFHGELTQRDPESDFVAMLVRASQAHEREVLSLLSGKSFRIKPPSEARRCEATIDAMTNEEPLILGGRLAIDDLIAEPAMLEITARGYVAGLVKWGSALDEHGRPRQNYAVQVAHHAHLLSKLGFGSAADGFIIDRDGSRVDFDFNVPMCGKNGPSGQSTHASMLEHARAIRDRTSRTEPALCAACKLCHWRSACRAALDQVADLTLVPQLGRELRRTIRPFAEDLSALARLDVGALEAAIDAGPKGVGPARLRRFVERAKLLTSPGAKAYAIRPLGLERRRRELFFDIEADPDRNLVYLHGIVERKASEGSAHSNNGDGGHGGDELTFHAFYVDEPTVEAEGHAFDHAYRFLSSATDARIYYWSKYERTAYRKLAQRHPHVCSVAEIEVLFDPSRAIDLLFDVVMPATEWPLNDHSIKTIAKHLGFRWRDLDPSGAASITWFDRWCRERSDQVRQRILDYNEDDCLATAAILDALIALPVRNESEIRIATA